jgi:hypothetical protein
VLDVDVRPPVAGQARLAVWAQLPVAQLTGEGLVTTRVAQGCDLVEQRGRPHVLVVGEPLAHVGLERIERIGLSALTHARLALAG